MEFGKRFAQLEKLWVVHKDDPLADFRRRKTEFGERFVKLTGLRQRKSEFGARLAQPKSPGVAYEDDLCGGLFQLTL